VTIIDKKKYVDNLWDWACFRGCFGSSSMSPTDIDGVVERNGYYLVIEAKSPHAQVPGGQRILFKSWVRDGKTTVLIIYGEPQKPEKMETMTPDGTVCTKKANMDDVREFVSAWYKMANSRPRLAANHY
jgi:hypothetical protein